MAKTASKKSRTCKQGENYYEIFPDENRTIEFIEDDKKYRATLADLLNVFDKQHNYALRFSRCSKDRNVIQITYQMFSGQYDPRDSAFGSGSINYFRVVAYLNSK